MSSAIACRRSQAPVALDPMLPVVAHRSRLLAAIFHVAGSHPHALGRVVLWLRPTVSTDDQTLTGRSAAAVFADRRSFQVV